MTIHSFSLTRLLAALTLLLSLGACAGTGSHPGGGESRVQSSGTPVNPFTDPGGADTATAKTTGAEPRKY